RSPRAAGSGVSAGRGRRVAAAALSPTLVQRTLSYAVRKRTAYEREGRRLAAAVETSGLTKRFGRTPALEGLDLTIAPGEAVGLLGHNGAGKTTTVRILATLIQPDAGSARIL